MEMEQLVEAVAERLFVEMEASGRHVHITQAQSHALFGHGLTAKRPLSQPGQFLANERVTVKGPKGEFTQVAVLGPERPQGQVEISETDGRVIGLRPPVRLSGDVQGTPGALLIGDMGQVQLAQGVIVAKRHIHMTPERAQQLGIRDGQTVSLRTYGKRPVVFQDVAVRISPKFCNYVHLDYDEANACGWKPGELGSIVL